MAGIYIHIPYCKQMCSYCDFQKSADLRHFDQTINAICREIEAQRDFISDHEVKTIYFGGGTPSLCHPSQISRILDVIDSNFDTAKVGEITMEANPDDLSAQYLEQLAATRVNRLSIGTQSFDQEQLKLMNRRHSAEQAREAVAAARAVGFDNITLDLIFGLEDPDLVILNRNVEELLALDVEHISAYHLTLEARTKLAALAKKGLFAPIDEEQSERQFVALHEALTRAGYEHYEISNYARSGRRSRHNSSYWHGDQYLGVGYGAHSFNGGERRWCDDTLIKYIEQPTYESEQITARDHYNEYVMTALRCCEGIDLQRIEAEFGSDMLQYLLHSAEPFLQGGNLMRVNDNIVVPPTRWMVCDMIASELFVL